MGDIHVTCRSCAPHAMVAIGEAKSRSRSAEPIHRTVGDRKNSALISCKKAPIWKDVHNRSLLHLTSIAVCASESLYILY
jgi:hypothetical protein